MRSAAPSTRAAGSRLWEALQVQARRLDWMAAAAFFLPLLLYLLTLAPTIYNLDSAELTTAAATGGIVRATGYPSYLILGRLWSLVPVGDVGYRLNLASAVYSAVALLCTEFILRRLGARAWARLCAWGMLAVAPYFWALSLIAEVYTLHIAFMAGIILASLRWQETPTPGRLFLLTLLFTLSVGNHAATVLLLPGLLFFLPACHPRSLLSGRAVPAGAAGVLVGAAVFLYLPLAYAQNPAFNYAGHYDAAGRFVARDLTSIDGLWWLLSARTFAGQMFGYHRLELAPQWLAFGQQLLLSFAAVGIGPGLIGLISLLRHRRRVGVLLLLFFAANVIFFVNYRVVDKNTMYLPTYLVWALWMGVGLQVIFDWVAGRRWSGEGVASARLRRFALRLVRGLVLAVVLLALGWNQQRVDLSDDWSTREQSVEILQLVERDAIIFGWWETVPAIQYMQLVEGERPDVLAINRFLISPEDMRALIMSQVEERPVYVNNPSLELIQTMEIHQVGPLYRISVRE